MCFSSKIDNVLFKWKKEKGVLKNEFSWGDSEKNCVTLTLLVVVKIENNSKFQRKFAEL